LTGRQPKNLVFNGGLPCGHEVLGNLEHILGPHERETGMAQRVVTHRRVPGRRQRFEGLE
jgi:hypothetical protein